MHRFLKAAVAATLLAVVALLAGCTGLGSTVTEKTGVPPLGRYVTIGDYYAQQVQSPEHAQAIRDMQALGREALFAAPAPEVPETPTE